ncbi:MAG: type II toxin-antitoxin system VapC family toxin [Planctomycetota bacterium]
MRALLLDTDVLVDYLRGREAAVSFVQAHADRVVVSAVTVAELYAGVREDAESQELDEFLRIFPQLAATSEIAKAGGLHKCRYARSHGVGLADALVAATAEAHGAELATLNVKHYPMFKGLSPPYRAS